MRKLILIGFSVLALSAATAQSSLSLTEGVPSLVYALPATELIFDIEIEKTVEKPGVFLQY